MCGKSEMPQNSGGSPTSYSDYYLKYSYSSPTRRPIFLFFHSIVLQNFLVNRYNSTLLYLRVLLFIFCWSKFLNFLAVTSSKRPLLMKLIKFYKPRAFIRIITACYLWQQSSNWNKPMSIYYNSNLSPGLRCIEQRKSQ